MALCTMTGLQVAFLLPALRHARALLCNHSNEARHLTMAILSSSALLQRSAVLQPISAAVLAILSSGRASVRNGGHTRMEEDIPFAFLDSSAAPGTIAGPILVSLPSNQQRSQFRRPAVSHSPQWWAHSNGGGHCPYPPPSSVRKSISAAVCVHNGRLTRMEKDIASAQYLASGVCYSFVQQSSRAVPCRATHLNRRGQYLCLSPGSVHHSVGRQCSSALLRAHSN